MSPEARVYRFILLVLAMALATFALGWAGVLFAAAVLAAIDRGDRVPWEAARAACVAWTLLLLVHVIPSMLADAPGRPMVATIGAALGLPTLVPPLVTIVFPALLAWCSATVMVALLHVAGRPRVPTPQGQAEA